MSDYGFVRAVTVVGIALCLAVSSLGSPASATNPDDDYGVLLRVGIYEKNPKAVIASGGTPRGFIPEILTAIGELSGLTVRYARCNLAQCLKMLEAGDVHMVPGLAYSADQAGRFIYGRETLLWRWSHIYLKTEMFLDDINDLKDLKVAVEQDSYENRKLLEAAQQQGWWPEVVETPSQAESFRLVRQGAADAAIASHFFGDNNAEDFGLVPAQLVLWPTPSLFVYNRYTDPTIVRAVDNALAVLKARPDSAYYQATHRWFTRPRDRFPVEWIIIGAAIAGATIAIVIAINAFLRRRVMQATAALRTSEERFKGFAECGSDFLWEMDANLRYSFLSEKFEEISGLPRPALLGKTCVEADLPVPDPETMERHLANLQTHTPFRALVYPCQGRDGTVTYLSLSGDPVFDGKGAFLGYRGTGSDVSTHKQAELAHRTAVTEAELASRAKSAFLATMSHEFRTPLNAIIGFSELQIHLPESQMTRERMIDYAESIHSSGTHMLALVNDVLDISAIEAGKLTLNKTELNLGAVIEHCLTELIEKAREKRIDLSASVEAQLPALFADEKSLRQILTNLLANSIKYTGPEGTVTVSARATETAVSVWVDDDGIGIPAEKIATITDPFVQANTNQMATNDGTGLGLSIVKSLVEAHGGTLRIANRDEGGARVAFDLPREDRLAS